MLKVLVAQSSDRPLQSLLETARSRTDVEVGMVATTVAETTEAIRARQFDVLVFPVDLVNVCRTIRVSLGLSTGSGPAFVVGARTLSKPLVVRSALYGFDGAVSVEPDPDVALSALVGISRGDQRLADEPLLGELGLRAGALDRRVTPVVEGDREILDLVAAGLSDAHIAVVLGVSVQHVRNRIENVLHENTLSHRTQLAVLAAAMWDLPDAD